MDRGEQTFDIVRKLTNAMNRSSKELRKAVQETLDWLCTSPEYRNYIDATVPDDFSLLPNEIIHDVVDSYGVEGSTTLPKLLPELVKIEGSWGEFGRELSACTTQDIYGLNVIFHLKAYDCAAGSSRERKIPFKEARNRFICSSFINGDFDLEQLTAVAPKLYSDMYKNHMERRKVKQASEA